MLYDFLSGDFPITLTFLIVLAVWANRHRSTVREYWNEESPFWRVVGRAALLMGPVIPLWVALFDNWRQLLGYSMAPSTRYKSDIFNTSLTPDALRWVSLALIAISLLSLALIYARRRHGVLMLVVMFFFAIGYFYFLNDIRMRADVFLVTTENSLDHPSFADVAFIVFWAIGMFAFIASVIAAGYAWLFSVLTLPLYLVYSFATRNRVSVAPEELTVLRMRKQPPISRPNERSDSTPIEHNGVAH